MNGHTELNKTTNIIIQKGSPQTLKNGLVALLSKTAVYCSRNELIQELNHKFVLVLIHHGFVNCNL